MRVSVCVEGGGSQKRGHWQCANLNLIQRILQDGLQLGSDELIIVLDLTPQRRCTCGEFARRFHGLDSMRQHQLEAAMHTMTFKRPSNG